MPTTLHETYDELDSFIRQFSIANDGMSMSVDWQKTINDIVTTHKTSQIRIPKAVLDGVDRVKGVVCELARWAETEKDHIALSSVKYDPKVSGDGEIEGVACTLKARRINDDGRTDSVNFGKTKLRWTGSEDGDGVYTSEHSTELTVFLETLVKWVKGELA